MWAKDQLIKAGSGKNGTGYAPVNDARQNMTKQNIVCFFFPLRGD